MPWLKKENPVYLYGFSRHSFTIDKQEKLEQEGFYVLGYIDKNAKEIREKYNVKCWEISEIPETTEMREKTQVVVMLQNANLHASVKENLIEVGFRRILFAPLIVETKEDKELMQSYEYFWEDDFFETGRYQTVEIDVEDIWSCEDDSFKYHELAKAEEYFSIMTEPFGSEIEAYCNLMGKSDEAFLEDRRRLVQRFEILYKTNKEYFRYASIHAKWSQGHWVIIDGVHRAAFLTYKGDTKIPMRVLRDEYNMYKKWKEQNQ